MTYTVDNLLLEKKMKKLLLLLSFFILGCTSLSTEKGGATLSIIPQPLSLVEGEGEFVINNKTSVVAVAEASGAVNFLLSDFKKAAGLNLSKATTAQANFIRFAKADGELAQKGKEAYSLTVTTNGVEIKANDGAGFFYGYQTLKQLLPTAIYSQKAKTNILWKVPCVMVEDAPRFQWRGLHLDVARHFMSIEDVKRYIDLMVLHKMNTFHWHLTDDQGWRLEIKKYPLLTQVGSKREGTLKGNLVTTFKDGVHKYDNEPHNGFYTQEQAREIVRYAAQRFITVVPEIELPGHAQAAISAYPWLGVQDIPEEEMLAKRADTSCPYACDACRQGKHRKVSGVWGVSPNVFKPSFEVSAFLKDVLTEVIDIFPSEMIHVGGDECPKLQWKLSPEVQKFIKDNNLGDENGAQSWFIHEMDEFLTKKGRSLIGWDEILDGGLAPNAAVMSWRGMWGGVRAAKMNHNVVMTPTTHVYLDYNEDVGPYSLLGIGGNLPLSKVYSFDPVGPSLKGKFEQYVLGGQANLWSEYNKSLEMIEYRGFPRVAAVAECVWSAKERKNFASFKNRLGVHLLRLAEMDVNFNIPSKAKKVATVTLKSEGKSSVVLTGLEGSQSVQVFLIPASKNLSAKISQVSFQSDSQTITKNRKNCELYEGLSQEGVFTFNLQKALKGECQLTISPSKVEAAGDVYVYIKTLDSQGKTN